MRRGETVTVAHDRERSKNVTVAGRSFVTGHRHGHALFPFHGSLSRSRALSLPRVTVTVTVFSWSLIGVLLLQPHPLDAETVKPDRCLQCGMAVPGDSLQRFLLTLKEGKEAVACSHACALLLKSNLRDRLLGLRAVDAETRQAVDAEAAHYVVGSRIRGVMGGQSVLAFASRDQAEQFLRSNGGTLRWFREISSP